MLKLPVHQQAADLGKAIPGGDKKVNTMPHQESTSPQKNCEKKDE